MPAISYLDFTLQIELEGSSSYRVSQIERVIGQTTERRASPFADLALADALRQVEGMWRGEEAWNPKAAQRVGRALFDALMVGEIRTLYDESRGRARTQGQGLRLRLQCLTPALAQLPWELLVDPKLGYLVLHPDTTLVRTAEVKHPAEALHVTLPLRILGMGAVPLDDPYLDVYEEQQLVEARLNGLIKDGLVSLTWLEEETWEALQRAVTAGPWHIFHFIGHGSFDEVADTGMMHLVGPEGKRERVSARQLADLLAFCPDLRLAFLGTCHSARHSHEDSFSGLATALIGRGFPGVVAMQEAIETDAARDFAVALYDGLAHGLPLERSVAAARLSLEHTYPRSLTWAQPTLHLHATDGVLFHLPASADPDSRPLPAAEGGVHLAAGRLTVDGDVVGRDKVTIIQHLTALPGVPTDYGPRIKNFLDEYLGDSKQRVPFGGREGELALLDAWLADESAPPYAMLTAEAGRGKSALLVQWATQLETRCEAEVVFVPVSIRFNTSLASVVFTALAARLGEVYGEPVKWADLSADQWRGVCQSYLSRTPPDGKTVVVILDGLDEAADWQAGADLFPRIPPEGVRVVVSARFLAGDTDERGWRRRLGWESTTLAQNLPLPLLTREGVAAVLEAMGNPLDSLANRVDMVGELFRLSKGDPLLVRLHVEALLPYGEQVALLAPETLQTLEPGLSGYFERWWEDQRQQWGDKTPLYERRVQTVLDLLATAQGPLDRDTLLALAPTDAGLTSRTLPDALRPLARIIVGDGQQVGYTFSHPRLGYYFWDALARGEQAQWEARYLAFGEQSLSALNQGSRAPHGVPTYIVQYYGAHLERAQAPDAACYALICEGWMRAWEALEGTHAGFLTDVVRAWQRADAAFAAGREAGSALVQQVRAALCQASVTALSANISADLLALAVQQGLHTPVQALVLVRQAPNEAQRAQLLVAVAPYLPSVLHGQALDAIHDIQELEPRATALTGIAPYLSAADLQLALNALCGIQGGERYAVALRGLAPRLSSEGLQVALEVAQTIRDESGRADALTGLAPYLSSEGVQVALDAARIIQDEGWRAVTLMGLAPYLRAPLQAQVRMEALDAARAIQNDRRRTIALTELVSSFSELLQVQVRMEALDAARAIGNLGCRAAALTGLVPYVSGPLQAQVLTEALGAARAIQSKGRRAAALTGLAPYVSGPLKAQVVAEALDAIRAIRGLEQHVSALIGLAPHLSSEDLQPALDIACAIMDEGSRAEALIGLGPYLGAEGLQLTLDTARAIRNEDWRAVTLRGLAPYLGTEGLEVALDTARAIRNENWRAATLTELALYLSAPLQAQVLAEALGVAQAIQDKRRRAAALTELAPHLSAPLQAQVLTEALDAARIIGDEGWRPDALVSLAPYLSAEGLQVALDVARVIGNEAQRTAALTRLAPHLVGESLQVALDIVFAIGDERSRAAALTGLAPYVSGPLQTEVLAEALDVTHAIQNEGGRAAALASLAPYLSGKNLESALDTARAIESERWRAAALASLAPYLSDKNLESALDAARGIQDEESRAAALTGLAPHVSGSPRTQVLTEALDVIRAIQNEGSRADALMGIAPCLGVADLQVALGAACTIRNEARRATALQRLAPYLGSGNSQVAWNAARGIRNESWRADTLGRLAPHLGAEGLQGALGEARAFRDNRRRAATLTELAPYFSGSLQAQVLAEALDVTRAIQHEGSRAAALTRLAPHLSNEDLQVALDAARAINDEGSRATALMALAPYLSNEDLQVALDVARAIENEESRAVALSELAPYLSGSIQAQVWMEALDAARAIRYEGSRAAALTGLAPYFSGSLQAQVLAEALDAARTIGDERQRTAALMGLTTHLSIWAERDRSNARPHWTPTLRQLAYQPRPSFFADLIPLLSFALALAGDEKEQVADGIVRTIQEVCTWWS